MTSERLYERTRKTARWGRGWVGEYWNPMLEIEYLLWQFRNRAALEHSFDWAGERRR